MKDLSRRTGEALAIPLKTADLVASLGALSTELNHDTSFRQEIEALLVGADIPWGEITEGLDGIQAFLAPKAIKAKLRRELGSDDPFSMKRVDFRQQAFEAWAPVGLVVHVAPANAWTVGFLSVIEGLLAGNVNFLKLSSHESDFALKMLQRLGELEPTGALGLRIIAEKISSQERARLKEILSHADAVSAWGGEEAIRSLREMTPEGARFVDWGPKISFAYFTRDSVTDERLERLAREICEGDQQACSAPQCVYLEGATPVELRAFAEELALHLKKLGPQITARSPDRAELSEITVVTRMQELKRALGSGDVIQGEGWRLLIDDKPALRPSPLFRSLWVKSVKREEVVSILRPFRRYLQTVGVAAKLAETVELSQLFSVAGCLRMTEIGSMMGSYEGEPHDGVYALARYAKRISFQGDKRYQSLGRLEELQPTVELSLIGPIMQKEDFQKMVVPDELSALTFRSGGSSGEPKFSCFTYADYHNQMQLAGFGLLAAGLEPAKDRTMNLFFGGGLYGGFVSFFTILESLEATQFPMAALPDHEAVGDAILMHRVDTLLGMPSYLIQLFAVNDKKFKKSCPVKKIFYGGEHFQSAQMEHLKRTYGVNLIRSAAYGSVDAGPLGYQCQYSQGSEHHLHHDTHLFEILALEKDEPADAGRLVVTTLMREGQGIRRYDLGDLVKKIPEVCACGRAGLRVELLGRHGDVVRVGSSFFNYARISRVLSEKAHYAGELQLKILPASTVDGKESVVFIMDEALAPTEQVIEKALLENEPDFYEAVVIDQVLIWRVERVASSAMARVAGSGKLIHVLDRRRS